MTDIWQLYSAKNLVIMPWLGGLTSAFGHCVNFKRRRRAYTVKDDEEQLPDKLVTLYSLPRC